MKKKLTICVLRKITKNMNQFHHLVFDFDNFFKNVFENQSPVKSIKQQINSVHICNEEERAHYWFAAELDNIFSKIVNNNQIKLIAIDVVKIITNSKYIDYDFSKLQLKYFKSVIIN